MLGQMKVTESTISLIRKRFRDPNKPKINQSQLADAMGYGKAWVSKLMNNGVKNLTPEQREKMEDFLQIRLMEFADSKVEVSPIVKEIAAKMNESKPIATIISALLEIDTNQSCGPKWIETKDMTKVGQEIIRIAFANEDKPGKVASEVLTLLENQ